MPVQRKWTQYDLVTETEKVHGSGPGFFNEMIAVTDDAFGGARPRQSRQVP
jgi:hypothetical protein